MANPVELQRAYYEETAGRYDELHGEDAEHKLALHLLLSFVRYYGFTSILDVGAGTGRVMRFFQAEAPDVRVVGVEPSAGLREAGYASGLSREQLIDGNALDLRHATGSFDLVCAFAVLHHVPTPARAVAEILRVARRAVFISDANNFGQGRLRVVKRAINAMGLWPLLNWVKTAGKGYTVSEEDGIAYSYSIFSNLNQIRRACPVVHVMGTRDSGANLYATAPHAAVLGVKDQGRAISDW